MNITEKLETVALNQLRIYDAGVEKGVATVEELREEINELTKQKEYWSSKAGQIIEDGGEIFNDYDNNKAIADYSKASGQATVAGTKAFGFKEHTYSASDYTNKNDKRGKYYLNTVSGIVTGIYYTIVLDDNFGYNGKVISVGTDYIEVDNYILPNQDSTTMIDDGSYILFPDNPDIQGDMIIGIAANAEGEKTVAMAIGAYAGGRKTTASGKASHAEGKGTKSGGYAAHSEGTDTEARGYAAHSEGRATVAEGYASFSGGYRTVAKGHSMRAIGKCNKSQGENDDIAVVIGNGTINNPSDALTVDWNGNVDISGDLISNGVSFDGVVKQVDSLEQKAVQVAEDINDLQTTIATDTNSIAATFTLEHNVNKIFNNTAFEKLEIILPTDVSSIFMSGITFVCGSSSFNFVTPDSIKYIGTDCLDGVFVPVNVGDSYDLIYEYNGIEWKCYVG